MIYGGFKAAMTDNKIPRLGKRIDVVLLLRGLVRDGDLRRNNGAWQNFFFTGNRWMNIRAEERKVYQITAYRVLLTRARQSMVICVPEGIPEGQTCLSDFYDGTYRYLKDIGIPET